MPPPIVARAEAEAAANAPETTEQILKDIRALLATLRSSDAKTDIERAVAATEDKD